MTSPNEKLLPTRIVGDFAKPALRVLLPFIEPGMPLILKREPDNIHDPNAIGVWFDVTPEILAKLVSDDQDLGGLQQLGYVPKVDNVQLIGCELVACVKNATNKTSITIHYTEPGAVA